MSAATPQRALMPDYLRLIALFGIVIVNVQYMGFSILQGLAPEASGTRGDSVTLLLVNGLALLKTYGLFSFMFGAGLGFLMRSAQRQDISLGKLYRNRMLGLAGLGLLHGCLLFPGDILLIYAVTGSILYFVRDWPVQQLVRLAIALLVLQMAIAAPLLSLDEAMPDDIIALERTVMLEGTIADVALFRSIVFSFVFLFGLFAQGVSALGWFCLGLAAVKSARMETPDHPMWRKLRWWCLGPGVLLSLLGAGLLQWSATLPGAILVVIAAPLTTLGYLGVIANIAKPPGPIMHMLLKAGGSSLTIYLSQSIILSTIFTGYGFGLWEQLSHAAATALAISVTLCLVLACVAWRRFFPLGPFEMVLRRITYAGQPPQS
ncbi:MAG: DUF418 domain-containing protein [Pseudomonadota bacterium]